VQEGVSDVLDPGINPFRYASARCVPSTAHAVFFSDDDAKMDLDASTDLKSERHQQRSHARLLYQGSPRLLVFLDSITDINSKLKVASFCWILVAG
jgi:hypothetical protein